MYQSQEKGAELEGEVDIHCCGSKYSERVGTVPMNIGLDLQPGEAGIVVDIRRKRGVRSLGNKRKSNAAR